MSLAQKSFSILQRDVFLFGCRLVTGALVARILGPESMGTLAVLLLVPTYAESFGRLKFDDAAVYVLGKQRVALGQMIFMTNLIALFSSFLVLTVLVLNAQWLIAKFFPFPVANLEFLLILTLLISVFRFLRMNNLKLHVYREDVTVLNRAVVMEALVGSVVTLTLLLGFDLGLSAVLLGSLSGLSIAVVYSVMKISKIEQPRPYWDLALFKEMAAFSIPHYLGSIVANLHAYVSNLITALYLPQAEIAYFSMAKDRASMFLERVPSALRLLLFPRVSKTLDNKESAALIARSFRLCFLMLFAVGFVLCFLIKPLVLVLYGEAFLPLLIPFYVVLPGLVLALAASVCSEYFNGIGRTDLAPKTLIGPLLLQVLLAFYLTQSQGLVGISLALLLGNLSYGVLLLVVFTIVSGGSWRDLRPGFADAKILYDFTSAQLCRVFGKLSGSVVSKTP